MQGSQICLNLFRLKCLPSQHTHTRTLLWEIPSLFLLFVIPSMFRLDVVFAGELRFREGKRNRANACQKITHPVLVNFSFSSGGVAPLSFHEEESENPWRGKQIFGGSLAPELGTTWMKGEGLGSRTQIQILTIWAGTLSNAQQLKLPSSKMTFGWLCVQKCTHMSKLSTDDVDSGLGTRSNKFCLHVLLNLRVTFFSLRLVEF